jgi:hypothetical protein
MQGLYLSAAASLLNDSGGGGLLVDSVSDAAQ